MKNYGLIKFKCLDCKNWISSDDVANGHCPICYSPTDLESYNLNFIVCPECGKKLEGEDLKNAYYSCCPYCLTLIEEEYFEDVD